MTLSENLFFMVWYSKVSLLKLSRGIFFPVFLVFIYVFLIFNNSAPALILEFVILISHVLLPMWKLQVMLKMVHHRLVSSMVPWWC